MVEGKHFERHIDEKYQTFKILIKTENVQSKTTNNKIDKKQLKQTKQT